MDMILISNQKLKIMLSPDDMNEYEISCETIDYDNTETRRVLWNILDLAKHKTGFDAAHEKVYIQVYPSRGGGCELFVTKLSEGELPSGMRSRLPRREVFPLARVCRASGIYRFSSVNRMAAASAALSKMGYRGRSAAFADPHSAAAYLVLDESGAHYPFICEYGGVRLTAPAAEYIAEHCSPICENDAVERLASLA